MPPRKAAKVSSGNQLVSRFFAGATPSASPLKRRSTGSSPPSADSTLDVGQTKSALLDTNCSSSCTTTISSSSSSVVRTLTSGGESASRAAELASECAARLAAIKTDNFARSLHFATRLAALDDEADSASDDPEVGNSTSPGNKRRITGNSGTSSSSKADGPAAGSKLTPLEVQVGELKRQHPGLLLCIEVGYKYRFYGADAVDAASALGIIAFRDKAYTVASIPSYRLSVHVRRLVAAGHAVGVCTQADPLKGGQPFVRALAAVYSPATLLEDDLIGCDGGGGSNEGARSSNTSSNTSSSNRKISSGSGNSGNNLKFFNGKPQFAQRKAHEFSGEGEKDGNISDDDGDEDNEDDFSTRGNAGNTIRGDANDDMDGVGNSGADGAERWLVCLLDLPASHAALAKTNPTNTRVDGMAESPAASATRIEASSSSVNFVQLDAADDDACLALVACDLQAGRIVHASWFDGPHRLGLAERLAQLNPVELLLPATAAAKVATADNTYPSWRSGSSKSNVDRESVVDGVASATECCVRAFVDSAVDATGRPRVVRVARLPSHSFELGAARAALREVLLGSAVPTSPSLMSASTSTSSAHSSSTPHISSSSSPLSSSSSFVSPASPLLRSPSLLPSSLTPEAQAASARCWAAARNLPEPLERCLGALLGYLRPLGLDRVLLAASDTGDQEEEGIVDVVDDKCGIEQSSVDEQRSSHKKRPREKLQSYQETTGLVLEPLDASLGTGGPPFSTGGMVYAGGRMHLSASTVRDLELFAQLRGSNSSHRGSLFWHLNRCATPSGARQLKRWLGAPLSDASAIVARLDAVACLAGHASPTTASSSLGSATSTAPSSCDSSGHNDKNIGEVSEAHPACLTSLLQALKDLGRKSRSRSSKSSQTSGSSDGVTADTVGGIDLESTAALLHYRRLSPTKLWKLLGAARYAVKSLPSLPQLTSQIGMRSSLLVSVLRPACMRSGVFLQRLAAVAALLDPAAGDDKARALRGGRCDDDAADGVPAGNSSSFDGTGFSSSHGVGSNSEALAAALITALAPLKEARRQEQLAINTLDNLLPALREASGLPNLQFKHMRSGATGMLEYLVELPVSYTNAEGGGRVPEGWTPVNRTQQVVRYLGGAPITEGLKHLEACRDAVTAAGARAWTMVLATADDNLFGDLKILVASLSTLDALKSLSLVAQLPGYTRPTFEAASIGGSSCSSNSTSIGRSGTKKTCDIDSGVLGVWPGGTLVAVAARHPTIERVLEETSATAMVPNDVVLGRGSHPRSATVVTGPNMGGKSLYVRTVALLVVLAQVGSYIPATSVHFGGGPFDGVFTRMGADDDIARGKSTFLVELNATAFILKHATAKSLVVLDELGRGTATHDGAAIAHATLHYLAFDTKCATLFVTHYNNIADLAESESASSSSTSSAFPSSLASSFPTQLPSPWAATGPPIQSNGRIVNVFMDFLIDGQSNSSNSELHSSSTAVSSSSNNVASPRSESSNLLADVTFLYRAVEGRASASHGLNVARLAGLPHRVLQEAAARAQEAQATEASWRLSRNEER